MDNLNEGAVDSEFMSKLDIACRIQIDRIIPNLSQLIGYRQRVAEIIVQNVSEIQTKEAIELFNYMNQKIKELLGL